MVFDPQALETGLNGATPENQRAVERLYRRVVGQEPNGMQIAVMIEKIEDELLLRGVI